jgi:hypothetical protein
MHFTENESAHMLLLASVIEMQGQCMRNKVNFLVITNHAKWYSAVHTSSCETWDYSQV